MLGPGCDTLEKFATELLDQFNLRADLNLNSVKTVLDEHIEDYGVYRTVDLLTAHDNRYVPAPAMATLSRNPELEALALR